MDNQMQEAENDNLTIVDNASPNEGGASPTVENETYKEIDMDSAKLIDGLEYENSEAKNNENGLTHKIVLSCIGIGIFGGIYIFLNSSMVILYDNYLSTISCIFLVFYWFYFLYILRTIFQHSWIKLLFLGILTGIFLINYLTKKWYFESHLAEAILYSTVIIPLLSFWISELKKNFICIYVRLILGLCGIAGFALATLWILTYDWRSYNTDLIFSTFITFFLFFLVFGGIILRKYYQTNINVKPGIECQIIWSKDFFKKVLLAIFLILTSAIFLYFIACLLIAGPNGTTHLFWPMLSSMIMGGFFIYILKIFYTKTCSFILTLLFSIPFLFVLYYSSFQGLNSHEELNHCRLEYGAWSKNSSFKPFYCKPIPRRACESQFGGCLEAMKPLILLYPETKQEVSVELEYTPGFSATFPLYDNAKKGWSVTASPDGTLLDHTTQQETYGLFWEGNLTHANYNTSKGWVIKGGEVREFLYEKLTEIGLNTKEKSDFIMFWYPKLQEYPYIQITFAGEDYNQSAPLKITPKPDSLLRVFMVAKPLDTSIVIEPQKLEKFERKGFSVVEWGGTVLE